VQSPMMSPAAAREGPLASVAATGATADDRAGAAPAVATASPQAATSEIRARTVGSDSIIRITPEESRPAIPSSCSRAADTLDQIRNQGIWQGSPDGGASHDRTAKRELGNATGLGVSGFTAAGPSRAA
jgi:hypothetical protein